MNASPLQILVVDDSPEDCLILRRLLTRTAPGRYTVSEASRGDECLAACAAAPPDCVVLDYRLPDMDGLAVLAALRAQSDVPVVLLTGVGNETLAVDALQQGAQDYLVKGGLTPERLQTTVQRAIASVRLARERDQTLTLLTSVLESLPVGVGVFDAGLHVRQANPAFADLAGCPAAALPGQLLPALWPDLEAALAEPCAQVLGGEGFRDLELHLPAGEGRAARWLSVSGTLALGGAGPGPLGLIAVQDITTRVQAEAARRASDERFRAMVEHGLEGIVLLGADGQPRYTSPTVTALLGYPVATFAAQRASGLCHPDDQPQLAAFIAALTAHPGATAQVTTRLRHQDGTWRWMQQRGRNQLENPAIAAIIVSLHDVTELVQAELAAQHAAERLQVLIDASQAFAAAGMDARAVLERIARIIADALRAGCVIRLRADDGPWLDTVTVYDPGPTVQAAVADHFLRTRIPLDGPNPAAVVVRSGQALLMPRLDLEAVRATVAPELWAALAPVGAHSGMLAPLRAHGQILGVLSFARYAPGQPAFTRDDLALAQDLADRAALVLHDIRLYQQAEAAQQAAAEAHARLDALISSMPSGVGYLDQELRYQLVNPALARINGRTPADHLGRTLPELLPGLARQLEPLVRQVFATGEPVPALELHGRPCPQDGVAHDWLISYFPVPGRAGAVAGVGVTVTDLTPIKRTEAALRASETNLRAILASTAQAYLLLDAELRLVHWNELAEAGVAERFGRSFRVGAPISDYMLPATVPTRTALMQRALRGERIETELDVSTPAVPRWLAVAYAPVCEPDGQIRGICVSALDITTRRQAEHELRASETRYRILFETMSQGVVYHDADGQIIAANPAAEHILGLTLSQLQGRTSLDPRWRTIHEDGTAFAGETHPAMVALRTGQEVREVVMGVYHPALEAHRWISIQVVPQFRPGEATPAQVYALFDDITERRQAAQALEYERQQLSAIVNTMHEGVIAARPDGTVALINPAALALGDLDPAHPPATLGEFVQQTMQRAFDGAGQALAPDAWPLRRVLCGEHFVGLELNLRSTRGEPERWQTFNGTPVYDEHGTLMLGILTGQDITQRRRDEATLRQQAAMLDHAHVLIRDAESRIISWNQGAQRLYGWTAEEAVGRVSHELFQTRFPTSLEQVQGELFATGRWEGELVHHRRDGSEVVVASLKVLFRDASGVPTHILEVNNDVTALKRTEEALREREAQLRQAYEAAELGTCYFDVASGLATLDARARAQFGVADETLAFAALSGRVHPEDLTRLRHEAQELRSSGHPGHTYAEFRVVHPDGSVHWLASHTRYSFSGSGGAGTPRGAYRVTQEITARKAAEAALQAAHAQAEEQAARLESLLAHAPVGIALVTPDLRYQVVNPYLAAMYGLTPEEHLGHTVREMRPGLATELEGLFGQVLAAGAPLLDYTLTGEIVADPGVPHTWNCSYFPVRSADGAILGAGVVLNDITARRQAEQARDEAHQQLEAIVEVLDEGVIAIRLDGSLVVMNRSARQRMLTDPTVRPRTVHELSIRNDLQLCNAEGQLLAPDDLPLMRVLRGERFRNWELRLRQAQPAEERWVLLSGMTIPADAGHPALGILTRSDITQRKRDEAALAAHAETLSRTNAELTHALKLKDEFLAMMSHELRTPLNVVLGISEALDEELYGPLSERQRKALATVTQSGRHLLAILSDILDLAYIEAGKAALDVWAVDVDILCRTALQFVHGAAQQKGLRLLRTVASGVEGLRADQRRLTQILVNLLDNAVKFTPAGGTVGLEVADDAAQERIAFTVWDTGIGIAEADYPRLFQPFTQIDGRLSRQYEGIGLGLTLVRRLVELHGGSISLESTPGQGSRFTVRLPWSSEENVAPAHMPAPPPLAWAQPPRLVIADDHELTLQFYAELLRGQGCEVALARTGAEAVSQVLATRPDVAVVDIQMPELDGLTAIRQLRADTSVRATPIIALTALALPGDRERCLAAGASAYLAKPVGVRTLMATIAEVLTPTDANPT
ncbi:MAG: PAS domain S-box protein [Chloroflexales bacterium]|nr:PAS domain S-box protein [Chloroflexales bacterium]